MEKNEINTKCLYYKLKEKGTEERLYCTRNESFFENNEGVLEPNCYQCMQDLEKLLSFIV